MMKRNKASIKKLIIAFSSIIILSGSSLLVTSVISNNYSTQDDEPIDNNKKDPSPILYSFIQNSFQDCSSYNEEYYQTKVESSIFSSLILKARMDINDNAKDIFCFSSIITNTDLTNSFDMKIYQNDDYDFQFNGIISSNGDAFSSIDYSGIIDKESFSKDCDLTIYKSNSSHCAANEVIDSLIINNIDSLFLELNNIFFNNSLDISMFDFGLINY